MDPVRSGRWIRSRNVFCLCARVFFFRYISICVLSVLRRHRRGTNSVDVRNERRLPNRSLFSCVFSIFHRRFCIFVCVCFYIFPSAGRFPFSHLKVFAPLITEDFFPRTVETFELSNMMEENKRFFDNNIQNVLFL